MLSISSIQFKSSHKFLDIETPNKDWLDNYRLVNYGYVLIGNDDPCKVIRTKIIKIKMFDDAVRILCDVRHILDLRKNLISLCILDYNFNFKSEDEY